MLAPAAAVFVHMGVPIALVGGTVAPCVGRFDHSFSGMGIGWVGGGVAPQCLKLSISRLHYKKTAPG